MLERVLIVGLGSIGRRHARLVRELVPQVRITALRHRDHTFDSEPGIDRCVATLDAALQLQPQAAVIANPASMHMEAATPLARAGVHLLIEKPIAATLPGVAELIETCRAKRVVLMTGYNLRFLLSLRRFRELLQQRRIGRVLSVRAEIGQFLPGWRPDADYRRSVSAQAALGGGALLELSHEIDYLRWLFGEVQWVSAVQSRQSDLEIDVEDTVHLTLGFMARSPEKPLVAALSMDFIRHDTTRTCTAIGEAGSLRWNALEGTVELFEPGASGWHTLFAHKHQRDDSYLGEWREFLASIDAGRTPEVSGDDGLAVLRIIEAARRSSATASVARVEQVPS